jgi:hypothetical protein
MKLMAMALASAFALSSTSTFAHTIRHGSNVRTHPMYSDAAPSVVLWQSERQFQWVREPRCVGPLGRLLWAHDSHWRRR